MALVTTSLSAAVGANDLLLKVASATGFAAGNLVLVGDEFMVCLAVSGTNIKVRSRGSHGTYAKDHAILAPVTTGLATEFPDPAPGRDTVRSPHQDWDMREAAVSGDFDPGASGGKNLTRNTIVHIVKATAWTQTITAPSLAQDGLIVRFVSTTAAAHVITYTAGFSGNTTTTDVATFAATVGVTFGIQAYAGKWAVIENEGVTIA